MSGQVEPLLTAKDVGEALNVSTRTVYRWWRRGEGPPYVQVERRAKRCKPEALRTYIANQSVEGVA